jgi:hypothetical protein
MRLIVSFFGSTRMPPAVYLRAVSRAIVTSSQAPRFHEWGRLISCPVSHHR